MSALEDWMRGLPAQKQVTGYVLARSVVASVADAAGDPGDEGLLDPHDMVDFAEALLGDAKAVRADVEQEGAA